MKKNNLKLDPKKLNQAILLIAMGVAIRVMLAGYPNIEPVLVIALMAGLILGGLYAFVVPFLIMVLSDYAIYALHYEGMFGWEIILGISFFTWTGMMFVGFVGTRMKPTFLFRMKGIGVFTGVAVFVTILYDLWTVVGIILLIPWASPGHILVAQIPFTIYHILSTLIFAPLFGTGYVYLKEYGMPILSDWKVEDKNPGNER
ncbi:MAG: hypothetical protein Q7J68_02685 [Thermoplasmata archaeon]|nr:hypothetical protein [Thermoplasmata archaeon]